MDGWRRSITYWNRMAIPAVCPLLFQYPRYPLLTTSLAQALPEAPVSLSVSYWLAFTQLALFGANSFFRCGASGAVLRLSITTGWITKWMRRWRGHATDPCHPKVRKDCIRQDFPGGHGIDIGSTVIHAVYRFNDK